LNADNAPAHIDYQIICHALCSVERAPTTEQKIRADKVFGGASQLKFMATLPQAPRVLWGGRRRSQG
jgi:hypothetical protein